MTQHENPNKGKAFIYTEECKLCGGSKKHSPVIPMLRKYNLEVVVKQVGLWRGWRDEARKIGLELPFVWVFDTKKGKTIDEAIENGVDDICEIES